MRSAAILCSLALATLTSCSKPATKPAETASKNQVKYLKGNLHKSSGPQWLAATPGNQIATAADFAANFYTPHSDAESAVFRDETVLLTACITKTLTSPQAEVDRTTRRNHTLQEIASTCWNMLSFPRNN
jgi:hypothetical protein